MISKWMYEQVRKLFISDNHSAQVPQWVARAIVAKGLAKTTENPGSKQPTIELTKEGLFYCAGREELDDCHCNKCSGMKAEVLRRRKAKKEAELLRKRWGDYAAESHLNACLNEEQTASLLGRRTNKKGSE